ncbi:DUF4350 domain-containing protein [Phenylobacterium sp.]|uniref:DUF4350 domain-containing protein n=1 Tax=Phenylobacterium sp. TaxID=1871053 RepID=UPI002FE16583
MSAAAEARQAKAATFSPRTVLALVLVGIVSFASLAVLSAYAPEMRISQDTGGHALSSSAVGFRGAVILLEEMGTPVEVNRQDPRRLQADPELVRVLTPGWKTEGKDLAAFPRAEKTLVVLPKWRTARDPIRAGRLRKAGLGASAAQATALLAPFADRTEVAHRKGVSRPRLHGVGAAFAGAGELPLGEIDRLQTISGPDWIPLLADELGRTVVGQSRRRPDVIVLADPDLLNNQGIDSLANARAGLIVLDPQAGKNGVSFDVTLNGLKQGRSIGRTLLEPPWLAATLCAVAAALLLGLHALARFGPARERGRAVALGKRALVDNSAGLVRMAGREPEMAADYVALIKSLIARAAGAERADEAWLEELARLRGAVPPAEIAAEAGRAKTRDELLAAARKLHDWRLEMTRERH